MLVLGAVIGGQPGVRAADYDEATGEPPYCTTCGHEMVSWPEEFGVTGELHADGSLEPPDGPA